MSRRPPPALPALAALLLVACGGPPPLRRAPPPSPLSGVPDSILPPGGLLLLGEVHGTREIPRRVGEIVAAASAQQPLVLALELPPGRTPSLQRFLLGPGGPAARRALVADPWWRDPFQDGRRSAAMVDLLETVRALRASGRRIAVAAIDTDDVYASAEDRESTLTANALAARRAYPGAAMILYAGSLHTGRAHQPFGPAFEWMAMRLVRARQSFVTLEARWDEGTSWSCRSNVKELCKVWRLEGSRDRPGHASRAALELYGARSPDQRRPAGAFAASTIMAAAPDPRRDARWATATAATADAGRGSESPHAAPHGAFDGAFDDAFDGAFSVGALTASPPAFLRYGGDDAAGAQAEAEVERQHLAALTSPAAWRSRALRAYRAGNFDECATAFAQLAVPLGNDAYDHACCLARAGRHTEAIERLRYALSHGFADRAYAQGDPDLVPLRNLPGWPFGRTPPHRW